MYVAPCQSGMIRITSSPGVVNLSVGHIEVCMNSTWGSVCSEFWGNKDARVVCHQLGFSTYGDNFIIFIYVEMHKN